MAVPVMPRLYRPHIPLKVRAIVAERQMLAATGCLPTDEFGVVLKHIPGVSAARRLEGALFHVAMAANCEVTDLRLDHDPAIENRMKRTVTKIRGGKLRQITEYSPDANSPDHLIYREKHNHHIKTNVRGEHGQYPDNTIAKRERRRQKKAKRTPCSRCFARYRIPPSKLCGRCQRVAKKHRDKTKRQWPARPFPKRRRK